MDSLFPPHSWDGVDDIVIVGGGLAGLVCALKLAPRPVTIVTAGLAGNGALSGDPINVLALDDDSLAKQGVPIEGVTSLGALRETVLRTPSIRLMENFIVEQFRAEDLFVTGLVARDRRGGLSDRLLMPARAVVLATGGIAELYDATQDPDVRGDGLAMAARAGALIADADLVRFPADDHRKSYRHVGGVHVDGNGRTTLDGLWACGEVACTGAAGTEVALREALVLAARVAADIRGQLPRHVASRWSVPVENDRPLAPEEDGETLSELRTLMNRHVGTLRDRAGLRDALAVIERLSAHASKPRTRNALIAAKLIAASALMREEGAAESRRNFITLAAADTAARTAAAPAREKALG